MTELTRALLLTLGEEITAAAQAVAARHGVVITDGGGSYNSGEATLKLKVAAVRADGLGPDQLAFQKHAALFGMKPEWLGQSITYRGQRYEITGLRPKSRKYPVLVRHLLNNREYQLGVDAVQRSLAGKE